jgi:hypothetical protein
LHQEGYEIVKNTNEDFVFIQRDGEVMPRALAKQFTDAEDTAEITAIERQHDALGLVIDNDTAVSLWDGEEYDYFMAVEGLMAMEPE